jgi:hypothetical protein
VILKLAQETSASMVWPDTEIGRLSKREWSFVPPSGILTVTFVPSSEVTVTPTPVNLIDDKCPIILVRLL